MGQTRVFNRIDTRKRMKLDLYFTLYLEIKSKQIKDLRVRTETMKLLANIGVSLHELGLHKDFSYTTLKALVINKKRERSWTSSNA